MSNLGVLLKNNFKCALGALQGKKSRKKQWVMIFLCIIGYLAIGAVFALQIFDLFETMGAIGLGQIPLFNSFQIVLMILVILSFQSVSEKSKTNDSDLLLSMPIKKVDIVLSKTFSKYLLNLILISMIIIPTIVLYCVYIEIKASVILWCLLLLIVLPLLGVGINYILNFLITRLFNKTKFSSLLKTLLIMLIFGGYMALYIYSSTVMGLQDITTIEGFLNTNFFVGWCVRIIYSNNYLNLLYVMLITVGVFILGIWAYVSIFGKTYLAYSASKSKIKYSSPSLMNGLVKKELKTYLTTPIFLVNTIIGPIVMIILAIFCLVIGKARILETLEADSTTILSIITLVSMMMCAMTQISCCTISLEGRNIWILKSTPVSTNKILFAKSLLNVIVFLPMHIITTIAFLLLFGGSAFEWIMMLSLPIILNLIVAFGGTMFNLLMPKLEWDSETQVVKQSMSLVVSMFLSIILSLVPLILTLVELSISTTAIITLAIYVAVLILVSILLFTRGKKRFEKLEC